MTQRRLWATGGRWPRRSALLTGLGLAGCAPLDRGTPVPRGRMEEAVVLGVPNERFFLTEAGLSAMDGEFTAARRRAQAAREAGRVVAAGPPALLAVSGGGEDGAFGAGLLNGWTAAGNRPTFFLVTGVSTGALTAPFAFLGPAWDGALRAVYTDITVADVAERRSIFAALTDDAMADTLPLSRTIARYLDERMMAAIAEGYRDGRLLFVATTNLDAQRPVVWNIGAIAASGHPAALDLVRRLLLASASIPGAFPPVMIDVSLGGERHQEMHVDGGAVAQAFLYPAALTAGRREEIRRGRAVTHVEAYVIRNGRLEAEGTPVERRTINIAAQAVATMLTSSGVNDVNRMYLNTLRDGIGFHLAYIGSDFREPYTSPFEQRYMRALYEYAFEQARRGYPWARQPPWEEVELPSAHRDVMRPRRR
jgi:predicted acylesterase/phospholipase RssA